MALEQASSDPSYVLNEVISRMRSVESKHAVMAEQMLVINKNMITEYKQLVRQLQILNAEIKEAKAEVFKTKEAMQEIVREMQQFARKDSVKVLEKYMDLWSPMHFVTQDEVKKLVGDARGKASSSQ